jgi:hypothetical protein
MNQSLFKTVNRRLENKQVSTSNPKWIRNSSRKTRAAIFIQHFSSHHMTTYQLQIQALAKKYLRKHPRTTSVIIATLLRHRGTSRTTFQLVRDRKGSVYQPEVIGRSWLINIWRDKTSSQQSRQIWKVNNKLIIIVKQKIF